MVVSMTEGYRLRSGVMLDHMVGECTTELHYMYKYVLQLYMCAYEIMLIRTQVYVHVHVIFHVACNLSSCTGIDPDHNEQTSFLAWQVSVKFCC